VLIEAESGSTRRFLTWLDGSHVRRLTVALEIFRRTIMQRIAVFFLCAGFWSGQASADACEQLATVVSGFVGGASGYGVVRTFGVANGWVAAGLYGAGIAVASTNASGWAASGCRSAADAFRWFGYVQCAYSTFNVDCGPPLEAAQSLLTDFLICPGCTYDEVLGAYFMDDYARQNYLREMQLRKWRTLTATTQVRPRNQFGLLNSSVVNSYFLGLQAGFQLLQTTQMYRSLK
jgi:hypothetical protein